MAVIRYYESIPGVEKRNWVYMSLNSIDDIKNKNISKEEAMEIIREEGLQLVHKNSDGSIWDTPEKDFLREFKGKSKEFTCADR